ncbi:UNC93-like protein 3 isoform X3 [Beta vulgaris subsp. vulgaris]|uniref:UNC93-like protein 3 isoform X3 n=1 Tax=Beta vulgaris subsp. vulgaris TaxID=3555 RepID=UPI0020371B32|nr:UNC93-like protein 3 isoform X3 [Beta vulgaris subsp. vulgaris]
MALCKISRVRSTMKVIWGLYRWEFWYWLFTAANLKPNWYTMVPASIYMGFCASIIWVGQGTYLTSAARSHARDCNLHEGTVIGNFNGEFWGIYATHQVIGNLLALFLLKDGEEGNTSGATMLFFVFLCILTFGCILMCFLSRRDVSLEQPNESSISCFSFVAFVAKSVVTPLFDTRILLIIPLFAYSGLQQAFVWAEFTKKIVKPALGESGIGGSMAVYGAADAICSLVAGRMTSSVSSVTWITLGGSSAHAIILLWILLKYSTTSGVLGMVYPLIMAAALGIGDGVMMTQINALLGMLFKHDMEGAFAQLKVWQSFSIAVVFFLTPYISLHVMAGVMLIALCIALASFFILTLKLEKGFSPR